MFVATCMVLTCVWNRVAHRETAVAVPQGLRIDGRGVDDVRSLVCKVRGASRGWCPWFACPHPAMLAAGRPAQPAWIGVVLSWRYTDVVHGDARSPAHRGSGDVCGALPTRL